MKQTSVLADNALLLPCLAVLCVVITSSKLSSVCVARGMVWPH